PDDRVAIGDAFYDLQDGQKRSSAAETERTS
ncbi:MAG: hypothetical protein QOF35_1968, partial [Actinomycetota bacterium]|nr:hypothetical protein [Actinomycetota bacterium]